MLNSSEGTGRINSPLARKAQRLYYGRPDDASDRDALRLISRVDRAHVVMLGECGLIDPAHAAILLDTIADLASDGYAAVLGRSRPRGLYLAYERVISERCGPQIGGLLHTGRSRNDLTATTTLIALRESGTELIGEGCRLLTALLRAAERDLDSVMAIHTHHQAAMPVTYGYYLTGVALALHRDLDRVVRSLTAIRRSPLGAHAVAGTDLELDTHRTAVLLGFAEGPVHAVDAIASRDCALDALGVAAGLVVTVSRLAADLQLWSTTEVGWIEFPDWLVGSSSAMPQKRNPFLLEYLKARPSQVVAAWVGAITAIKGAPFSNSIEVGTEAMASVGPALCTARDVLAVASLVVAGAQLRRHAAETAAHTSFVDATAFANELVRRGVPFRSAHEQIGTHVRAALECGAPWPPPDLPALDIADVVDRARYGGGPGRRAEALAIAWQLRASLHRDHERMRRRLQQAVATLDEAVQATRCG